MAKIKTETKNGKVYTYRNGKLFSIQPIKQTAAKSTPSGYGTSSRETASFVNSSVGVGSSRNRIGSVQHTNAQNAQKSQNAVRESKTGKVYKAGVGYQDRAAQSKTYNYGSSNIAKARKAEEAAKNQLKVAEDEQKKLVDRYGSDTAALEASIAGYSNRSDFEQNLDAANKKLSTAQETFNNARNNRSMVERNETLKKQEDYNTFVQNKYTDLMNRDKDAELYIKEGERSRDSAKLFKDINKNDAWKIGESFAAVGVSEKEDKNAAKVFMNDAERNQYNYLLGKFGKIEADNYYNAIYDDKVAPRFASYLSDMVEADEKDSGIVAAGKTVGRSAQAFLTGAQEGFSGIGAAFRRMTGDTSIDSESLASMTHAEIASKLDGAEKIVNDVVYNVGHMMPTIVTSIATGGLGAPAVVSAIASSSSVGLSSFGNTYEEAIREGYSPDQATAYGILTGVSEGALQYALNGISKIAGGALTGKAAKAAQGAIKRVAKNPQAIKALNLILERSVDASGEFTEEYLQEVLDPVFKNIAYNESNEVKLVSEEALYSGLLGALTAGGMNAATDIQQTASRYLENSRSEKAFDDAYVSAGVQAAQNNPYEVRLQATPVLNKYAGRKTVDGVLGRTYETNMPVLESLAGKDAVLRAVGEEIAVTSKDIKIPSRRESGSIEITDPGNRARYESEIVGVFNGELPAHEEVIIGRTPEILTLYGAPDLPLHMTQATARKIAYPEGYQGGKHNLGIEALKQLPDQLSNPLAIIESKTQPNSIVALTEWNDTNGFKVIVPIHFNKNGTVTVENQVISAYGKEKLGALLGKNNENVAYTREDKKISDLLAHGLQLAEASRDDVFFYPNVPQGTQGVKDSIFMNRESNTENQKYEMVSDKQVANETSDIRAMNKNHPSNQMRIGSFELEGVAKTQQQMVAIKAMEHLSKLIETDFYVFESYVNENGKRVYKDLEGVEHSAPNGWFDYKDNSFHIDLNAGNKGQGLMLYTISHELTHFIKKWSPAKFEVLSNFLVDQIGTDTVEYLVAKQIEKAANYERTLTYDEALEEMIADSMETMLSSGNVMEILAELKKRDQTLWQKIMDFFKDFADRLKELVDAYKNARPDSVEGNLVADMKSVIGKIEELFADGIYEASENYQNTAVSFDAETQSAAPMRSERTWTESEYVQMREKTAKKLSKDLNISLATAYKYIDDINSVAALIADDRVRLDYEPNIDASATVIKPNSEYKFTVDMSTLCAKRLLTTGTFDAIQKQLPNKVFTSEDIVALREMMQNRGYEVACGICYVESTRRDMGRITQDFINSYKESQKTGKPITRTNSNGKVVDLVKTEAEKKSTTDKTSDKFYADKNYTPTLADLNTTDIDLVKRDHPLVYEAYLNFMNKRGQAKPKLLETRAEYKGEILKHFKRKNYVASRNAAGGLRLQSFSDFEVPHMIDMMQIVMDMSRVGLKSQAYTKVPAFAEVFGNTGVKINLSLISKGSGLDADGNLIFDDVEGMNHKEAFKLREKFSKNVGTILVGKNDAHIIAAMADPRIDFIIPFHKSSWKESLYESLGLTGYEDFTDTQNEKYIDKSRGEIKNFDPSEYWDFSKSGDENAQIYLKKCREDGRIPKFPQFQGYEGYWKLLIDFKMYDNNGVGSPQEVVHPTFEMDAAEKILSEYKGGHRSFPVAKDVVEDFVKQYKVSGEETFYDSGANGVKYSERVTEQSPRQTLDEMARQSGVKDSVLGKGENARDGMTKEDLNSLAATEPHKGKAELLNPTQAAEAQTEIMKKASAAELEEARRISEESVEVNPTKKKTPVRESVAAALDWFERKFVDSGHEVAKQSPRAEHYYNAVRGATQAADYAIGRTHGRKTHQTDIFGMGNKGESLTTIFEPINAKGEAYAAAFNKYMYHKHNVDRMGLVERAREKIAALEDEKTKLMENPLVKGEMEELESGAISTLEISDELKSVLRLESTIEALASVENKPIFGRDVTAQASREIAAEILRANPEFARFETRVRKYLKGNMELRVQSGLVSQELADALEEIYPNYVPIFRAGGSESNYSHDNLTVGKTLGRAVGGDGPIGNLEDSIAAQTRSIYKNGRKNIATEALMDALAKNGNLKEMVSGERYKQEKSEFKTDKNTIMFYQKGDMVELTVTPEIAEAFRAFNGVQENKGAVTIRKVNEVYKKLITQYNPTFIVRNFLKDWQDAVIYSKFGVRAFAKNYGRALAGIKNNSAEWQLYCASGGFASSIFENYAETQVENRGKKRNVLQKGVDKISQANMVVEQAPRFAEFLATMEAHGMNAGNVTQDVIMEALYNANDITCNFGRSGTVGKYVNKYAVPFFNPSIQGFDKLVRTFKAKDAKSCVRAFVGFAAKSAMIGLVPSILNELMHLLSDDDEEKEAWERLSDYTKNTYYCFYIGDGQFFKLPKGRIASIIGNLGQGIARDMLAQSEEDKNDWGAYGSSIVNNVAPTNPLENFIGASLVRTLGQNKKWTGQTIETDEDKKKPVAERYDETTSETAKFMSKNMGLANIGLSPKQIDTLIDEGTGVVGDIVLPMTSAQAQQSPIVNSFVTDSNVKNKRSGQVYDLKTQLAQEAYMEGESDVPSQTDLALDFIADSQKAVWDNKDKIKEINMQPITAQEIGRRIFGNSDRIKEVSELNLENARINEKILARYDAFRESLEKNYRVDSSADVDTQKAQVKLAYLKAYREAMGDEATVENVLTDSQKKFCTAAKTKGVDTKTYLDYVEATNGMTKDADRVSALVKMGLPEEKTKSIYEAAIQSSKIKEENSIAYAQRQGISTMEFLKTKYDLDDAALSTTQKTKEAGSSTVIKQAEGYDIPKYKTETLENIQNIGVSIEDYAYIDDRIAAYGDKVGYIKSFGFNDKQTSGLVQSLVMGKSAKDKMRVANEEYGISNNDYIRTYIAGYSSVGSKSERNAQIRSFVDSLPGLTDDQKDILYEYNAVSRGKYNSEKEKSGSSGGKRSSGKRSSSRKKTVPNLSVPNVKNISISKTRSDLVRSAMQNYMKQKQQSDLTAAYKAQLDEIDKNPFMTQKIRAAQKAKIKERFGIN